MRCLLDTSAVFALLIPRDQHHSDARAFARQARLELITTAHIMGEAFTSVRGKVGYSVAMGWVRSVHQSRLVTVHHLSREDDALTWAVIEQYSGVPLSYADASLIVLGRRLGLKSVFAFDEDFRGAGLELVP